MNTLVEYAPILWDGFLKTLLVAAGAGVVMLVTSFAFGVAGVSRSGWLRWPIRVMVEFLRGTSAYVQLFWAYFALPLFGIYIDAIIVGIIVLGLNVGSYGSEVVRGAILSVPRDQTEGAVALNLSRFQSMRYVILPQALVSMIPPMGNLAIDLLKITPLVSLITIADLTFQAQVIRQQTNDTILIYGFVLVVYFILSSAIAQVFTKAGAHFSRGIDIQRGGR